MGEFTKRIREIMKNSTFCYAKPNGEGFADKDECECRMKGEWNCQAIKDRNKFHSYFEGLKYEEIPFKRKEIIKQVPKEIKESQWYKDNVEE